MIKLRKITSIVTTTVGKETSGVGGGIKVGDIHSFAPTCKCCWRDYEWWVDMQTVKTCLLLLLLLLKEAGLLTNGNCDYWASRRDDEVDDEVLGKYH